MFLRTRMHNDSTCLNEHIVSNFAVAIGRKSSYKNQAPQCICIAMCSPLYKSVLECSEYLQTLIAQASFGDTEWEGMLKTHQAFELF